jgi:tetratricopeptide (TPR) repeat protein
MKERVIRVFISSTFKDMKDERDELVKFVFPQLKKLCLERHVTWTEVDLRWGITDEQKAEGKVLPICLQEIKKCRPYFLGILGERYGWIPMEIDAKVLEQEPWVKSNGDKSVTELEILHGVLNDPEMADHAFFYFRSKKYIDIFPEEVQEDFIEIPTREEINLLGNQKAVELSDQRREKLEKLKNRIRQSGFPVHEDYPNPAAFGDLVLQDFVALIDRLFPKDELPDEIEREAQIHESYALSRCGCYIGGEAYFDRLEKHVASTDPPMVITGESGTGKSSLVANWSSRFRENHPGQKIVVHFIGASALSADPVEMLKRLMKELYRLADIRAEVPSRGKEVISGFEVCLQRVAEKGKCILILDALNNLEDKENAQGLGWLPEKIPSNIRIIISTLPGRCFDLLQQRGWPVLTVRPFETEEKRLFINTYLKQFSKSLSTGIAERIINSPQTANPLFLQTLVEELRIYGDHQTLIEKCEHYLQAKNPVELFKKLLERYIVDYEKDRPGLVQDTLSSIWASRRGLPEPELLHIASAGGKLILRRQWSEFYIPAEHLFVMSSGRLNFSFDYFRQAVEETFMEREFVRKNIHLRIAEYYIRSIQFEIKDSTTGKPITDPERLEFAKKYMWGYVPEHYIREITWQLFKAEDWETLYTLLSSPVFNLVHHEYDYYENERCWSAIQENSAHSFFAAFQNFQEIAAEFGLTMLKPIADQAMHFGHPDLAIQIQQMLLSKAKENDQDPGFTERLKIAWNHHNIGNIRLALTQFEEIEAEAKSSGDFGAMRTAIIDKGKMIHFLDQFEKAQIVLQQGEQLCREANDRHRLKSVLIAIGTNLNRLQKYDEALVTLKEASVLAKEFNDKDTQHIILGELSNNALMRGDYEKALQYAIEKEDICKMLGDTKSLGLAYMSHATVLFKQENEREGLRYFKMAEEKCEEAGYMPGLGGAKMNQGTLLLKMNLFAEAEIKLREAARIFREIGNENNCNLAYEYLANVLNKTGQYQEALSFIDSLISSFISSGAAEELTNCSLEKLNILVNLGRFDDVARLHGKIRNEIVATGQDSMIDKMGRFFSLEQAIAEMTKQHDIEVLARAKNLSRDVAMALVQQAWVIVILDLQMYHWLNIAIDDIKTISQQPDCNEYLRVANFFKGWLFLKQGLLEESHEIMVEASNAAWEAKDGPVFSWATLGLGKLYFKIANYPEAKKFAEIAVLGFKKINENIGLRFAEETLETINKKIADGGIQFQEPNEHKKDKDSTVQNKKSDGMTESDEEFWQKLVNISTWVPEFENLRNADTRTRKDIMRVIYLIVKSGIQDQTKEAIQILSSQLTAMHRIQDIGPVLALSGWLLESQGQIENAMKVFREMEGICTGINYERGLASSWMNQGIILRRTGNPKEAFKLLDKSERIFEKIGDKLNLIINYREQFKLLKVSGLTDKALTMCDKREQLCKEAGDKQGLGDAYNEHGCLLSDLGKNQESFEFHKKAVDINRSINNKSGYQVALGNMANCLGLNNQTEDAVRLLEEKEAICREIGDQEELAASFGYRATIFNKQNDFNRAIEFYEKEEAICREIGAEFRLQVSIGNKGTAFAKQGRKKEAYIMFKEKEAICRRMNFTYGLVIALINIAACHMDDQNFRDALSYASEGLDLTRRTGYSQFIGNFQKLIEDCKQRVNLNPSPQVRHNVPAPASGMKNPTTTSSNTTVPPQQPDYNQLLANLQSKEKEIRKKVNNQQEYQANIREQGNVLSQLGRYKEALQKYELSAEVCAKNGFQESYTQCLLLQSVLLITRLDKPKRTRSLLEEAVLIARENGFTQLEKDANSMLSEIKRS